jgi:MFS transporter, DHA1 family, multidrug resistance protein
VADTIVGPVRHLGRVEFIALLAMSMSLAALGIDLMLPAFEQMRADLGLDPGATEIAGTVTAYFLGLAVGQFIYGPLADRYGRRPALYLGYGIYGLGALLAAMSPTLEILLLSRVLWGLGAAGPAVVTRAVIRDTFEGDQMSRAMSMIVAVFILVPVIAPSMGAAAITIMSWRWLFVGCVGATAIMALWARRLPETLRPTDRLPLRFGRIARAAGSVVTNRQALLYTLALTALYSVFTSYIASSENIFVGVFDQARLYPIIFGGLAATIGLSMLVNARIVRSVGTLRLAHLVLLGYLGMAAVLAALAVLTGGRPPLWLFLVGMAAMLSAHALLIPNFTTIALAPLGHIAGTASSVVGGIQLGVGASLGLLLDRSFDGSVLPLSLGFLGYGVVALFLVLIAERGNLFGQLAGRGAVVAPAQLPPPPIDPVRTGQPDES